MINLTKRGWINIKINLHFRLKLKSALNYRLSEVHSMCMESEHTYYVRCLYSLLLMA